MTEREPLPQELAAQRYSLLHDFIGTAALYELVAASSEDQELAGKETHEYLAECTSEELFEAAYKLDHLYAAISVANPRVTIRTVDVFARAFMEIVRSPEKNLDVETVQSLEQTVTMARYRTQNHSPEPLPF